MTSVTTDVALIGAGPIGLEMAVALKKAGIDYVHIEKGQIAETISWFPRMMRFFSSPDRIAISGVPIPRTEELKCTREEYLAYLRGIVSQFDLRIRTYEEVTSVERTGGGFKLRSVSFGKEYAYDARRIVFVTGDMHMPRMLNIPGEDLPHVSHYFVEPHKYFKRKVLIVGGKNSAVEAAVRLHHCGADVTLSYRGRELSPNSIKFWLLPEIKGLFNRKEISFLGGTLPRKIQYGAVTLLDKKTRKTFDVEADFVLLLVGYRADPALLKNMGIRLIGRSEKPSFRKLTMETNVPGVYIAGTAAAGTQQSYTVFIENCHIHVRRILAALKGEPPPDEEKKFDRPEN